MTEDLYTLEEIIEKLEKIRNRESEPINPCKVWLSLAKEIQKIKQDFFVES